MVFLFFPLLLCRTCVLQYIVHSIQSPSVLSSLSELESEPSYATAKVFRPLLRPVRWEKHPRGGNEQRPAPRGSHAP